jgi:amino acid transporter
MTKNKIKPLTLFLLLTLLVAVCPVSGQTGDSPVPIQSTENKKPNSILGWAIGGSAVLVLGISITMMVRRRRTTIGGMQDQSKASPAIATTQSISTPGSGV